MQLFILNESFEIVGVIESFKSIEWVKRYYETGDFVLNTTATVENVQMLKKRNYIAREDDEMICQIEKVNLKTTSESGNEITVSGRSIEKLLGQRIVWNQTNSKGGETAESFIRRLVSENAINTSDEKRRIPKLKLGVLKGYTETIDKQITGDNLLTAVMEICKTYEYGFKIMMDKAGDLVFELYKGEDRSYRQEKNSFVIFSDDFDNIGNTEYEYDETNITNVALIGGEGEGKDRKYQTTGDGEGFERYELFVDAKDISSNEGEITMAEYNKLLLERGKEKIAENSFVETYAGEIENTNTYIYRKDYELGDIVQIENKFGMIATSRILEIIESENTNGYRLVPTFGAWEV